MTGGAEPDPAELHPSAPGDGPPEHRLSKLFPARLDDDQRAVYDAIAGGRRAQGPQLFPLVDAGGGLEGPFNAFLLQPHLGFAWQALGSAVRFETALSDRAREIAILVTAVAADAGFEWRSHEPIARHAGLTGDELDAVRTSRFGAFADEVEEVAAATAYALCLRGDLDDEEYRRVVGALGPAGLFELLTIVGYYQALALQLRVFRVS
jgi:4-carboxymuconolactone decarboxylase